MLVVEVSLWLTIWVLQLLPELVAVVVVLLHNLYHVAIYQVNLYLFMTFTQISVSYCLSNGKDGRNLRHNIIW